MGLISELSLSDESPLATTIFPLRISSAIFSTPAEGTMALRMSPGPQPAAFICLALFRKCCIPAGSASRISTRR